MISIRISHVSVCSLHRMSDESWVFEVVSLDEFLDVGGHRRIIVCCIMRRLAMIAEILSRINDSRPLHGSLPYQSVHWPLQVSSEDPELSEFTASPRRGPYLLILR